jgi:PAS domain S-box-containing protein
MPESKEKIRILVVDDERIITMHLEELLTNMDYNVVGTASDAEGAIQKAKEFQPDLIFMDIIMPGEKTGIDAANEIKDELGIPVIFISAFADDKIVEKAKISEPFGYIVKPVQDQELKAAIEIAIYKKETDMKLKESEEKYRTLVEESRDGVGIIQDGIFKYLNPALFEILGNPDKKDSMSYLDYFSEDCKERVQNVYYNGLNGEEVPTINEFFLIRGDGSYLPVEANTTKINFDGKPAILFFFRNIDERKHMKQLLDYLVREINGRNQIVISNIERLIPKNTDKIGEKEMKNALSNLFANAAIIKKAYKLLQVSQVEKELIPVDPREKINSAIKTVVQQFPEKDIQINTHFMGLTPQVLADEFIEDVFHILIENSVEYTKGKVVEIDIYAKADSLEKPNYVEIKIEDHSRGIPDDEKTKIFDQWMVSEEKRGTGLGLSMAKFVLNRYSGEIHIEDRVKGIAEKGCMYILKLPSIKYT